MNDKMTEVLSALVPLLLGGSPQDFIKKLLGGNTGAANYDAFAALENRYATMGLKTYGNHANVYDVQRAIDQRLGQLNINPYSGTGQGLAEIAFSMSRLFPGMTESLLGIPQASEMMQFARTGAHGISYAMGQRGFSIFDESSTMRGMDFAMRNMREMYGFAVDNGKEVRSYTNGLSGREMGLVNQRLLSSRMAYENGDGRMFNLSDDKEYGEFIKQLRSMGETLNKTVASLTKFTGSVDESIKLMDRIAGGDAFGGSRQRAAAVAQHAMNMATAIRSTAVEAGIDPKQLYDMTSAGADLMANSVGLGGWAGGSAMFTEASAHAKIGYARWLAAHPGASKEARERAKAANTATATNYIGSGADVLSILIASNMDKISEQDMEEIKSIYASGRGESASEIVRKAVGDQEFYRFKNNKNLQAGMRVILRDQGGEGWSLYNELVRKGMGSAASEGSLIGANIMMRDVISETAGAINIAGGGESSADVIARSRRAEFDALKRFANEVGIKNTSRFGVNNVASFREFMKDAAAGMGINVTEFERRINSETVAGQDQLVNANRMDEQQEREAKAAIEEMARGSLDGKALDSVLKKLENGDLEGAYDEVAKNSGMRYLDAREQRKKVFGGRISGRKADQLLGKLKDLGEFYANELTEKERQELDDEAKRENARNNGLANEKSAMSMSNSDFVKYVMRNVKAGGTYELGGKETVDAAINRAAATTMADMLEGSLGNVAGDAFTDLIYGKKSSLDGRRTGGLDASLARKMKEGMSFEDAFRSILADDELSKNLDLSEEELEKLREYYSSGEGRNELEKAGKDFNANLNRSLKASTSGNASVSDEEIRQKVLNRTDARFSAIVKGVQGVDEANFGTIGTKDNVDNDYNREASDVIASKDVREAEKAAGILEKTGDKTRQEQERTLAEGRARAEGDLKSLRDRIKQAGLSKEEIQKLMSDTEHESAAYDRLMKTVHHEGENKGAGERREKKLSELLDKVISAGAGDLMAMDDAEYEKAKGRREEATKEVVKADIRDEDMMYQLLSSIKALVDGFTGNDIIKKIAGGTPISVKITN